MRNLSILLAATLVLAAAGCRTRPPSGPPCLMIPAGAPAAIDAAWGKLPWTRITPARLSYWNGHQTSHRPRTEVKLAYDAEAVYVIFRVEDRYVRALAAPGDTQVYNDSCVEFFFAPGPDVAAGYFNLEVSCGGTAFMGFQGAPGQRSAIVPPEECRQIEIAHSLPARIDPEITKRTTWTLEYRLPLALLRNYRPVTAPAPGAVWRGNFHKCAEATSHPHWLTWALIDAPGPNFHRPQFFGILRFE